MNIEQAYKKHKKLLSIYNKIINDIMKELEPDMLSLNKEQLERGETATNGTMPRYINSKYLKYKRKKGSMSLPNMDYKDTGRFYKSFSARTSGGETEISSKGVSYAKYLEDRVSTNDLYGIDDTGMEQLREKANELLTERIRDLLK